MQKVKGYIFIAEREGSNFLFGENSGKSSVNKKPYDNFVMNDLTPYSSVEHAEKCAMQYKNDMKSVKKIYLAKLDMLIAESQEELDYFKNKDNLIVIGYYDMIALFGRFVKGKGVYPLYGSDFGQNGLKPFRNSKKKNMFDIIKYYASEAARQGGAKASIATFNLKRIKEI